MAIGDVTEQPKFEVIDLHSFCSSFPQKTKNEIKRSNIINTIESYFSNDNNIIIIEGQEGIGKTNLLAQFSVKHCDTSVSLFIKPSSSYGYDQQLLKLDLCDQLVFFNEQTTNNFDHLNTDIDAFLKIQIYKAQKKTSRSKKTLYFVIDGLDDIPNDSQYVRKAILDLLPFDTMGFKFLFSENGGEGLQNDLKVPAYTIQQFPLPMLTDNEVFSLFPELNMERDKESLRDIYNICKGIPSYLASIRRIYESGVSIEEIINDTPNKLPWFFEVEWGHADLNDNNLKMLLSILAHDRKRHDIHFFSVLLGINCSEIKNILTPLTFISIDENEIGFVSEAFREFAANKLSDLKGKVKNTIIEFFLKNPESESSLKNLPGYLRESNRLNDLLDYLDPKNISKILEVSESLNQFNQVTDLGFEAAFDLENFGELLRFGLQKSIIQENNKSKIWNSEIEARMSLNEYDSAVALAQRAILVEDCFQLLVLIAKHKIEQGFTPEDELVEQIKTLYKKIDYNSLGDRSLKIASDLMYVNPELAVDLVERSTGSEGENAIDWALASLPLYFMDNENSIYDNTQAIQNLNMKIKDPNAKLFSTKVSLRFKKFSSKEIMKAVQKLENVSDRLYILGRWTRRRKSIDGAYDVIKYALQQIIDNADYSPNARIYCDLCEQLPSIETNKAKEIIDTVDSQIFNIERLGPTEDYIRLQLLIIKSQIKYAFKDANERLVHLYYYLNGIRDRSTLASGYAQFLATISEIDEKSALEKSEGLHTLVGKDLEKCVRDLLSITAEHYINTKQVIKSLAIIKPDITLNFIKDFNTQTKRNTAYFSFLKEYIEQPLTNIDFKLVLITFEKIEDLDDKDIFLINLLSRIKEEKGLTDDILDQLIPFLNKLSSVYETELKCDACCIALSLLTNSEKYAPLRVQILHILQSAWNIIDVAWRKVDIGFKIAKKLSAVSIEEARDFLKLTDEYRESAILSDPDFSWAYISSCRIMIRAFSGLIDKKIYDHDDIRNIERVISIIPSYGEQALLWNYLSLKFFAHNESDTGKKLVNDHLKKCINNINNDDCRYRDYIIARTFPSLYLTHKLTAFEFIDHLNFHSRDEAIYRITDFIFTKNSLNDPYESSVKVGYDLTYEEIIDICELIEKVDNDSLVFELINNVSISMTSKKNRNNYSYSQKLNVADKLKSLVNEKLPNPKYIKHQGYKIICLSQILTIEPKPSLQEWLNLIKLAENIPNLSDRALVITTIACSLPSKQINKTKELLSKVNDLIEQVDVTLDKICLYELVGKKMLLKDQQTSKRYLKKGILESLNNDSDEIYSVQKKIIDIAYRIDPDFSSSLVSLTNDDPVREKRSKKRLNEEIDKLHLKDNIIDKKSVEDKELEALPEVSWKLLAALNANRIETLPPEAIRPYLRSFSKLPLSMAYPIVSWIIENSVRRYEKDNKASQFIKPLFQSTLIEIDTLLKLSGRNIVQIKNLKEQNEKFDSKSFIAKPGEREIVKDYLRNWFKGNVKDYLKICDPYFGPEDLEILQLILSVNIDCKVKILTSQQHVDRQKGPNQSVEDTFRNYWRLRISDQAPPETDVIIIGTKSTGQLPIHDRWLISNGSGLRVGTSYNSLGISRESEISKLSGNEIKEIEFEVDQYIDYIKREYNGERLSHTMFPL